MSKYDLESFIEEFEPKMKELLAAKIAEINSDKNDQVILEDINDKAWFFQSFDDKNKSFKNFAFYYFNDIKCLANGRSFVQMVDFEVDLLIMDREDGQIQKRVLRYSRALYEASAKLWDSVAVGFSKPTLTILAPMDVKLNNSSYRHKVFGIRIEFELIN